VAKEQFYIQCHLTKDTTEGTAHMVTWIRKELAIPGKVIDRLEDTDTGRLESGWRVVTANSEALPENVLMKRSRDFKRTRIASDI
jgi:hypothetical protein